MSAFSSCTQYMMEDLLWFWLPCRLCRLSRLHAHTLKLPCAIRPSMGLSCWLLQPICLPVLCVRVRVRSRSPWGPALALKGIIQCVHTEWVIRKWRVGGREVKPSSADLLGVKEKRKACLLPGLCRKRQWVMLGCHSWLEFDCHAPISVVYCHIFAAVRKRRFWPLNMECRNKVSGQQYTGRSINVWTTKQSLTTFSGCQEIRYTSASHSIFSQKKMWNQVGLHWIFMTVKVLINNVRMPQILCVNRPTSSLWYEKYTSLKV